MNSKKRAIKPQIFTTLYPGDIIKTNPKERNSTMNEQKLNTFSHKLEGEISLPETLDCGQSFRWKEISPGKWQGIIRKDIVTLSIEDGILKAEGVSDEEALINYLDLKTDYVKLKESYKRYEPLKNAIDYCPGVRILKQDFFETLITFILSQNNNIPRIKGLVEALCRKYGEKIGEDAYAFPTCEVLANTTVEDIALIKCGFRAKYILDAAQKVYSGEIDPKLIPAMDLEEAEKYLCQIKGVGKKVADCTLLFGCYKLDAFPVDVWIKRALNIFFPEGFPEDIKETSGIAQQYLFHYIRTSPQCEELRAEERRLRAEEKELKKKKKEEKESLKA